MKLIHLTDPHLVPTGENLFGLDPADRLRRTFIQINRDHADAELCVITGDLTDKGTREAYGLLKELLEELAVPHRLLLGNHDRRANFAAAFPEAERDANGYIQSTLDLPAGRFIFLDTLVEGRGYGALDDGRRDWLQARLREAPDRPVFLFAHHPLQPIGMPHIKPIDLVDTGPVMDAVTAHGGVQHVFCGHVHVDVGGSWRGVPFSASRGVAHQIVPNLVRTDAEFINDDPAFVVALIGKTGTLLHRFEVEARREIIAVSPTIKPRQEPVS